MYVGSILELYTTPIGWIVYDILWTVVSVTPLIMLPFVAIIIRNWAQAVRTTDIRPSVAVALKRSETDLIAALLVVTLAGIPFVTLELDFLEYEPGEWYLPEQTVPETVTTGNDPTTYKDTVGVGLGNLGSTLQMDQPQVPIAWALIIRLTAGATHAVVAALDTVASRGDLRAAQAAMAQYTLQDQALGAELGQFTQWCFKPARAKFMQWAADGTWATKLPNEARQVLEDEPGDINRVGSRVFQLTPGLYRPCDSAACNDTLQARRPIDGWPYEAGRDAGRSPEEEALPGQPYCDEWWTDSTLGIRERILNASDSSPGGGITARANQIVNVLGLDNPFNLKDMLAERVIRNSYTGQSPTAGVYQLGRPRDLTSAGTWTWGPIRDAAALVGAAWETGKMAVMLELIKTALPMVQAVFLMAVYAFLAPIMLFTGFRIKGVLIGAFAIFALKFLSAIWAMADFVDIELQNAIYPELTVSELTNAHALTERAVFNMVMIGMYLGLPILFLMTMAWTGAALSATLFTVAGGYAGLSQAQAAGNQGASMSAGAATKAAGR